MPTYFVTFTPSAFSPARIYRSVPAAKRPRPYKLPPCINGDIAFFVGGGYFPVSWAPRHGTHPDFVCYDLIGVPHPVPVVSTTPLISTGHGSRRKGFPSLPRSLACMYILITIFFFFWNFKSAFETTTKKKPIITQRSVCSTNNISIAGRGSVSRRRQFKKIFPTAPLSSPWAGVYFFFSSASRNGIFPPEIKTIQYY